MKLQDQDRTRLKVALARRFADSGLNYSDIARISNVHASQVHRICSGRFQTLSHNVVQVCKALGLDEPPFGKTKMTDPDQARIESTAVALWDRSREDADRIVRLLRQLSDLRRS
ncbi:MAG: helix-turn-helix domain-containing protein [Alphaproteobacteria bacterium]|nr:helix-turn-helix domain-containing protein [Alphaproteobacteria bacterium]